MMLLSLPFALLLFGQLAVVLTEEPVVWIGAVTDSSFAIHLDVTPNVTEVVLSITSNFTITTATKPAFDSSSKIGRGDTYGALRRYRFTNLDPFTTYFVGIRGQAFPTTSVASVRTFPQEGNATDVTLALSSCQRGASNDGAFEDIRTWFDNQRNEATFLMLHMGDMVYSDIDTNDVSRFESSLREVLEQEHVQSVFSSMPVPYMYDDHDFGVNDAGFEAASREAALQNYFDMVPHYNLPARDASYHAFTIGRVRVIMTDTRALAGRDPGSTLGVSQREWFLSELENAQSYEVVVWMTSKPWIGRSEEGRDSWAGFPDERRLISERIAALNVTNLVAVAGDAHMLAADDGTNSDYAARGAGFPVFQAAPLHNRGSSKGGPYSEGCVAFRHFNNEQYGILRITQLDSVDGPCVEFLGYKKGQRNEPALRFRRCGKLGGVTGTGGQETGCDIASFPSWVSVLIVVAAAWSVLLIVLIGVVWRFCIHRRRRAEMPAKDDEQVDTPDDEEPPKEGEMHDIPEAQRTETSEIDDVQEIQKAHEGT